MRNSAFDHYIINGIVILEQPLFEQLINAVQKQRIPLICVDDLTSTMRTPSGSPRNLYRAKQPVLRRSHSRR